MPKITHRGAAKMERLAPALVSSDVSWDDLRLLLECAKVRSFRRASERLRVSSSTIVRRIERLERAMGARLFDRLPEGVALTSDGQAVLKGAERMESAALDVVRFQREAAAEKRSATISITEGLGSYWVMPQLVRFQRRYPSLMVSMCCAMDSADVLRLEADMAVQFERPTSADLIVTRLGRLHVYPFASREYLDIYGVPKSASDMVRHRLVNQVAPQLDERAWARELGVDSIDAIVGMETNASTALLYAVENGAGIGALPTYVYVLNRQIVPVDIGARHQMDIWLTYHPDTKHSQEKKLLIEWVRSIFDSREHPWFSDRFIHPRDLAEMCDATPYGVR